MDGYKIDKYPIAVQFKGSNYISPFWIKLCIFLEERKRGTGRGGPTSSDICFNCGKQGHWLSKTILNKLFLGQMNAEKMIGGKN